MRMESAKRVKKEDSIQDLNYSHDLSCDKILRIEYDLTAKLKDLKFNPPIEYVYAPLEYAKDIHINFVKKYFNTPYKEIMFLGMNPGPWGMCQTGIPFGESQVVNEWFSINGFVNHPENEHPLRKISGLKCERSEVSGKKFWGYFKKLCITPENFFKHSVVYNICPLAFLTKSGKNVTPAELKANESKVLMDLCDKAFIDIVIGLNIKLVIGIGKFAEKRATLTLKRNNLKSVQVSSIPHPSPRNAKNFSNWESLTTKKLQELNLLHFFTG